MHTPIYTFVRMKFHGQVNAWTSIKQTRSVPGLIGPINYFVFPTNPVFQFLYILPLTTALALSSVSYEECVLPPAPMARSLELYGNRKVASTNNSTKINGTKGNKSTILI